MFFETNDFIPNDFSVFEFSWGEGIEASSIRPYHALSFRVKGGATFSTADNSVSVKTGEIVFVPAFCNYVLEKVCETVIVVHFYSDANLPKKIKKFTPLMPDYYQKFFLDMLDIWSKKQSGFEHKFRQLFHKTVYNIEQEYMADNSGFSKIQLAIEYIHDNFSDRNLCVSNVAKMMNMSETYLRKLFLKNLSTTPIEYINNLRLNSAKELLSSGYYAVYEVADKCGFENQYYFSTFLKKHTGYPPTYFIKNGLNRE